MLSMCEVLSFIPSTQKRIRLPPLLSSMVSFPEFLWKKCLLFLILRTLNLPSDL